MSGISSSLGTDLFLSSESAAEERDNLDGDHRLLYDLTAEQGIERQSSASDRRTGHRTAEQGKYTSNRGRSSC
jgi:hypothetical protein